MSIRKRKIVIIALSMVVLMAITACDGAKDTAPTSSPKVTQSPVADETKTPETNVASYNQSSFFDGKDLADVKDRLPKEPKISTEQPAEYLDYEIGTYGGNLRMVRMDAEWDADVYVMNNESLLVLPGATGTDIQPNIAKDFKVNDDSTEFTFFLRQGLKWSDGTDVTMEDFKFTYDNVIANKELTPVAPSWMKDGGNIDGELYEFIIVDDWTFKIKFKETYGGFLFNTCLQGDKGYTNFLKPAHFLKEYHKDMPEYNESKVKQYASANSIDLDKDMWTKVFNAIDITTDELSSKFSIGFPRLYPWLLVEAANELYTYERNPYYFKVDSAGNQLPYIDTITSENIPDVELITMKTLAGEIDLTRETPSLINMSMYKENEKNGYKTVMANMHVNPTDIYLNLTYDDPTWRLVTGNVNFRKALNYAINRDEIIETIYYGNAVPSSIMESEFSVDKANKLLDEMGMDKRNKDGYRLAPNGKPFSILFETAAEAPDIMPLCELLVEMWGDVGVKTELKRIEGSLMGNKSAANDLQTRVIWTHIPLWYQQDWGYRFWGKNWDIWRTKATEATITNEDGTEKKIKLSGEEPPKEVQEFYSLAENSFVATPKEAKEVVLPKLYKSMRENIWFITHIEKVKQPFILNEKIANYTDEGFAIGIDYAGEELFYKK